MSLPKPTSDTFAPSTTLPDCTSVTRISPALPNLTGSEYRTKMATPCLGTSVAPDGGLICVTRGSVLSDVPKTTLVLAGGTTLVAAYPSADEVTTPESTVNVKAAADAKFPAGSTKSPSGTVIVYCCPAVSLAPAGSSKKALLSTTCAVETGSRYEAPASHESSKLPEPASNVSSASNTNVVQGGTEVPVGASTETTGPVLSELTENS
mmetsp:Transcript_4871/g.8826  ORF Transcript_4871/g.8826 Transcript_4871/m.8826 type:complete len:208 (+) Transcript_4871:3203-3826(+)